MLPGEAYAETCIQPAFPPSTWGYLMKLKRAKFSGEAESCNYTLQGHLNI